MLLLITLPDVCHTIKHSKISHLFMPNMKKYYKVPQLGSFLYLGPSINGLVTDGNTKLCCRGFILALFQSTTANKIDPEHTQYYKRLLLVCEAIILRVTVKRIEVFSSFYVDI